MKDRSRSIGDRISLAIRIFTISGSIFIDLLINLACFLTLSRTGGLQHTTKNVVSFLILIAANVLILIIYNILAVHQGKKLAAVICKPINAMAKAADQIAAGNLDIDIAVKDNGDELSSLAGAFRKIISSLRLLKDDIDSLTRNGLEGKLDTRADTANHLGSYREIIEGVNQTLDAVKAPLDVASDFVSRLADGERLQSIDNTYGGYYAVLIDNLNKVNASIGILSTETDKLVVAGKSGQLDVRGDGEKLSGIYAQIVGGINQTFDAIREPLDVASAYVDKLAKGEKQESIDNVYGGFYATLIGNLNEVGKSVSRLVDETMKLVQAGQNGDLTVRGSTDALSGVYADVITGFNQTLESISAPITEAEEVVAKVTVNDFTVSMTGVYSGELRELASSINGMIGRMRDLERYVTDLGGGRINRKNIEALRKIGKRCENDSLTPAEVSTMTAIIDLIDEANRLAAAAYSGDLTVRGDADQYLGIYRQIIEGMNKTMEAFSAPLEEANHVLAEFADGDLTVGMTGDYQGEYNEIKNSMNNAIASFRELITNITDAAEQVSSGSGQVSGASQALSQGATEQASSVEKLTASITQIASQTKQNAVNATQASELTTAVRAEAESGNRQMAQMIQSINEINDASEGISKIIKVIDDIAFQTKILSLNAAVEAAHAGQYGKGFAVVAEEVRTLAAKSTEAAQETTTLIESSVHKTEAGTKIAREAAASLDKIVGSVEKSAALVKEIASASNEQATAIAQINQGVNQVSQVVQTNSATAEESAASSEELSGQASVLLEEVTKFKLGKSTRRAAAAAKATESKKPADTLDKFPIK